MRYPRDERGRQFALKMLANFIYALYNGNDISCLTGFGLFEKEDIQHGFSW
jgi:hypothetical protein